MTLPSNSSSHTCAHCGKDAALICKGCKDLPDGHTSSGLITVRYCSGECQRNDWDRHKPFCKKAQLRQKVYRAGDIARDVFYVFGRVTNMWTAERIDKAGAMWLVHPPKKYNGKSQLIPFPPACLTTEEEKNAFLSHLKCQSALSTLHVFLKALLQGFGAQIQEVHFHTKNEVFTLRQVFNGGIINATDHRHIILLLTLKNGEEYAIDISGAQYGWKETVMPWDAYKNSRVRYITERVDFGQAVERVRTQAEKEGEVRVWTQKIIEQFTVVLNDAVSIFLGIRMKFDAMLDLPASEFKKQEEVLLDLILQRLEAYKSYGEEAGLWRVQGWKLGEFDREFKPFAWSR